MKLTNDNKRGLIGSAIFHALLILLLVLLGFYTPLPLPAEEGILVNFGDNKNGKGMMEPPRPRRTQPVKKQTRPKTTPPKRKVTPKSKPQPKAKQKILTQDQEKTAFIESGIKKRKEEERKRKAKLEKERKIKAEQDRKAAEAREKQRIAAEKKRQEELARQKAIAEQKAKEEAERKRKAEEKRKKDAINSRVKNAFGGNGASDKNNKSRGQGVTFPAGNQGVKTGSANAKNYGEGQGRGNGNGISYNLGGRSIVGAPPKPDYPGNEEGIVVVRVKVDRNGRVTSATPGAKGSTTINSALLAAAKRAALKTRFSVNKNAPFEQVGTITYRFVLD
ncbi:hypothetical protein EMN47_01825 [Prolixibacteraceae bacterium JC049]|nr:hypothetical protein [Prolixibacteraceae bacterium JC049]